VAGGAAGEELGVRGKQTGRILSVAAVAATFALALGPGVASAYPRVATAWLGSWKTNQGTVQFTEISVCHSGPQYIDGEDCQLTGRWHRPGHGWTAIHGYTPVGKKYKGESWEGCFALPELTRGDQCDFNTGGDLLIERSGNSFVEGYWKECGLGENCASHHPWRGSKILACKAAVDSFLRHDSCGGLNDPAVFWSGGWTLTNGQEGDKRIVYGLLKLTAEGNKVTGTYDYSGGGRFAGTYDAEELSGSFHDKQVSNGYLNVTLNSDRVSFDGYFKNCRKYTPGCTKYPVHGEHG
jgi:hypothetical protein